MLEKLSTSPDACARGWIKAFSHSLAREDAEATSRLFQADSHWRNWCGVSWQIATISGSKKLSDAFCRRAREVAATGFEIDSGWLPPRNAVVAGVDVIEAIFRFTTVNGAGVGVVRLVPAHAGETAPRAWTISTLLDIESNAPAMSKDALPSGDRFPASPNRQRRVEIAFEAREPDVLVVGGGHAGLSAAVELKRMGFDALVVDRHERVGDNWRLRYNGLKLHNKTPVNHLRYMPFPQTWPEYIPKDDIANWLEAYVESMGIDFWTATSFEGAEYNEMTQSWTAVVRRGNGSSRTLHPKHIVMATSVSGTPNIPTIATIENFTGKILHSSRFAGGAEWSGQSVVVIGTGTSAHDICQDLHINGADVTMVQRSPTLVVNIEPAQLYDKTYLGEGPPVDVRDLLNASVPLPVLKASHKLITKEVRAMDAPLLSRLEQVGFRLDFGEDGTGWPLKFRTRGGGYYFNVGCSDLIADRKIRLLQHSEIEKFVPDGLQLKDGSILTANLVVLATGYKGPDYIVSSLFGKDVADRVGPVWGFDSDTQELRNMWSRTGQPGLWFTGGAFSQCRIYSRFIALQIDAIERGRLEKAATVRPDLHDQGIRL
jgi:cation diffusion facilitator CzcD-associated flavoprotein CzcO